MAIVSSTLPCLHTRRAPQLPQRITNVLNKVPHSGLSQPKKDTAFASPKAAYGKLLNSRNLVEGTEREHLVRYPFPEFCVRKRRLLFHRMNKHLPLRFS